MSAQHTPGPWFTSLSGAFFTDVRAGDAAIGRRIAATWIQNQPRTREGALRAARENEANAQLIAASPDLLEALEKLNAAYDRLKSPGYPKADAQKLADAAIAKAKGEQL
ncbi:hypothetical protein [Achromobacter insolitus]|uniref:hypothetical protein n=1 Tax=Achromobacter insolitus TaxID=217204 RepID=UPI0028B13B8F|nr:hypothetical protein [Achromobacter insolitus]